MSRKRIKVEPRPPKIVTLFYVGLLASNAAPDDDSDVLTVRVGGVDVFAQLAHHLDRLPKPIKAEFAVNGTKYETQALEWQRGEYDDSVCGDPECCGGGMQPWGFWLDGYYGDQDLVAILDDLHGQDVSLAVRLSGYVEPLVTAELAHHLTLEVFGQASRHLKPGDELTLPLSEMRPLATARLIRPHADQVRRLVAAPPFKRKSHR